MAQDDVHLSEAGLALGLSLGGGGGGTVDQPATAHGGSSRPRREPLSSSQCRLEPSLTLSMPDDATATAAATATATASGGGGAAHSVSSLSVGVKRERAEEEEADGERVSSTAREDDDDGSTRKKLRLTKEQSALLEDRFREHSTLNPKQKVALAKQLNLRPRQVEVWFQNRRARTKLKQTEVDCEFLKQCCDKLTEENRRLQRELHELRALKFTPPAPPLQHGGGAAPPTPPFYMQLPAATLTICPSCERLGGAATAGKADPDVRPKAGPGRTTHHFFNPFTHSAAC